MLRNIIFVLCFMTAAQFISSCKKDSYSFGEIKAPTELALTTTVVGITGSAPNGDGSGSVTIAATSKNAVTYKVDFGNGDSAMVPAGNITYNYKTPGTNNYTVTVTAVGTGGAVSVISKRITVFVNFQIPTAMMAALTGGNSRVWVTDKNAAGHFGVGPADQFLPIWYEAPPNTREACAYDDEITFTKVAENVISMSVNNKGTSFSTAAASAFYGFGGGDACYSINAGGNKTLGFSSASSNSTSAQSTRIQFTVPGNGIINFGTGGTVCEIIAYTNTTLFLRNIGADGNAWYQKLTIK